jgi:hypothetical protein
MALRWKMFVEALWEAACAPALAPVAAGVRMPPANASIGTPLHSTSTPVAPLL